MRKLSGGKYEIIVVMPKKKAVRFSRKELIQKGFPVALVTSILLLSALGVNRLSDLKRVDDYQTWLAAHPFFGTVKTIIDGDTIEMVNGRTVRLLGTNAPGRGERGFDLATASLKRMVAGKPVWLEYDRYQDDKYNRLLAWVWIDCEGKPKFLPFDYMHLSYNQSRLGLKENPEGCREGKLVNEELVKRGLARVEVFKDRGELKYEERLKRLPHPPR